jgi:hypothetical protein
MIVIMPALSRKEPFRHFKDERYFEAAASGRTPIDSRPPA